MTTTKWELLVAIEEKIGRIYKNTKNIVLVSYTGCCIIIIIICLFLSDSEEIVRVCTNIVFVVVILCFCSIYISFRKIKKLEIVFEIINYYCDDGEGGIEIEI